MSYTPTDEQVRSLAMFLWRRWNPNGPTWAQTNQASRDEAMEEARAVLVAVGPSIAAAERERMGQRALDPTVGIPFDHDHDVAIVAAWITDPIHDPEAR